MAWFSPVTGEWAEGSRAPHSQLPRFNTATAVAGRLILPAVDQWAPRGPGPAEVPVGNGLAYDPRTDRWSPIPELPTALGAFAAGDRLVAWANETVEPGPTTLAAFVWSPG